MRTKSPFETFVVAGAGMAGLAGLSEPALAQDAPQAQGGQELEEVVVTGFRRSLTDATTAKRLEPMQPYFAQMAKATGTAWGEKVSPPDVAASITLSGQSGPLEVHVDVSRFIDVEAEKKRLAKQREDFTKFIKSIDAKLSNAAFVDKAPADVVQQQRDKRAELATQLETVEAALAKLK